MCPGSALVRFDGGDRTGPAVTTAAQSGDERALQAFGEVGDWLGVGLADIAAVLDPDLIVVGGGVSEAGDLLLDPAQRAFTRERRLGGMRDLSLRRAALGNAAGMIGAADLARSR
jgi:glucokinase